MGMYFNDDGKFTFSETFSFQDSTETSKVVGPDIDTAIDLATMSGGNTDIVAGNINAGNNLIIETGGNLNILAAFDTTEVTRTKQRSGSGFELEICIGRTTNISAEVYGEMELSERKTTSANVVQSNISAGKNIIIDTGKNVTLQAVNMSAGEDIDITAEEKINIISAKQVFE